MNNLAIAITGPTGSGKTTVSKILAKRIGRCVNIDVDHVKHMIECGFQKNILPNGHERWDYKEWLLVVESITLLVANFQQRGFAVIINGYIGDDGWNRLVNQINLTNKYLLLPDIEVVKERDSCRSDEAIMGENAVIKHYEHFTQGADFKDFVILDTSFQTADETAKEIENLIIETRA